MIRLDEEIVLKVMGLLMRKEWSHNEILEYVEVFRELEYAVETQGSKDDQDKVQSTDETGS